ncbi:hypothetical protein [Microbacterium sp. CFBP9034]|uniref:hypothetical protein n=1 Tax=Microbacterium sp. CFBP9034 TaxID=3096540 RepID=UPI002A69F952|nr:hypothetical protein [Microbacterium sp. CFBP9034]MDY0909423.1 hypothetical protein [Microbacterium sp. CFBP9034]
MNRPRRWWTCTLAGLVAGSVALGVGLALVPVVSARAAPTPEFTLEFLGLTPGVPHTDTGTYILERDAHLVDFDWLELSGVLADEGVTIDIDVCDAAGRCIDPTALADPVRFAGGVHTVSVTVELAAAPDNGEVGAISGRLSFLAEDGLAVTGGDAAPWLAAGAAALAVTALGLALTRPGHGPGERRQRPGRNSPGWGERDRA